MRARRTGFQPVLKFSPIRIPDGLASRIHFRTAYCTQAGSGGMLGLLPKASLPGHAAKSGANHVGDFPPRRLRLWPDKGRILLPPIASGPEHGVDAASKLGGWLRPGASVKGVLPKRTGVRPSSGAAMFGHQNALKSDDAVIRSPVSAPGTGALRFGQHVLKMRPPDKLFTTVSLSAGRA